MALILTLEQSPRPQAVRQMRLVEGELVIGRSADADWRLDDPDMYVSRAHCTIACVHGRYQVTDTSSGGLFIDGSRAPLGAGNSAPLHDAPGCNSAIMSSASRCKARRQSAHMNKRHRRRRSVSNGIRSSPNAASRLNPPGGPPDCPTRSNTPLRRSLPIPTGRNRKIARPCSTIRSASIRCRPSGRITEAGIFFCRARLQAAGSGDRHTTTQAATQSGTTAGAEAAEVSAH